MIYELGIKTPKVGRIRAKINEKGFTEKIDFVNAKNEIIGKVDFKEYTVYERPLHTNQAVEDPLDKYLTKVAVYVDGFYVGTYDVAPFGWWGPWNAL